MARSKRQYDDDDGRTIVDMSGVERPSLIGRIPQGVRNPNQWKSEEPKPSRPWEESGYNREERGAAVKGALSAALLIGLAYIVGLGAIVGIIFLIAKFVIL